MLAEGSGHTADELAEMFNGYGIVTEDDRKNFTLDSLSKEKRFVFAKTLADTYVYEFEKVRKYN